MKTTQKLLIFHSENGQDCNSNFLVETTADKDSAVLKYLEYIGDFAWDNATTVLQVKVQNKEVQGLYFEFKDLVQEGYDCFRLDDDYGISLVSFDTYKVQ